MGVSCGRSMSVARRTSGVETILLVELGRREWAMVGEESLSVLWAPQIWGLSSSDGVENVEMDGMRRGSRGAKQRKRRFAPGQSGAEIQDFLADSGKAKRDRHDARRSKSTGTVFEKRRLGGNRKMLYVLA